MTESERNETTADPFCGFNLGSTVYRATTDKASPARKFVFESAIVRLSSDFGYNHVYQNGLDIVDPEWQPPPDEQGNDTIGIPSQSIIIYRYYDVGSSLFGNGKARELETYARGLNELILKIKNLVIKHEGVLFEPSLFRCYLVAHSMGGLVVRAFLQNKRLGSDEARQCVDKVFTYATLHNGIDIGGINVPSWLLINEMHTFNCERIVNFLDMKAIAKSKDGRVDFIPENVFPIDRFFCMIGTNRGDYEAEQGLSRTFAGHGSDGLVRVENASVWRIKRNNNILQPAATAYTFRSHSGYFGIVNSEDEYQNLVRFLFGDIHVDIWFDVTSVTLPDVLTEKCAEVETLYQFKILVSVRGKRWYLSRRVSEEDSCACRTHEQLAAPSNSEDQNIYLSTIFLANGSRVNRARPGLAYSINLGIKALDYRIRKAFWAEGHFEGRYLFKDTLLVEMIVPTKSIEYLKLRKGKLEISIPVKTLVNPGLKGNIRLIASAWN